MTRFPGLYRPGLIEARRAGAAATPSAWFPGLYRPGLIEAPGKPPPLRWSLAFPGLYRPGLIEAREGGARGGAGMTRFRGFTAPASLKPVDPEHARPIVDRFPGLYRPGLIEAS